MLIIWDSGNVGFPGGSEVKASACNVGDLGSIPGSGRFSGEGHGNPLQYSCLDNPMDRGAWCPWGGSQRVGHDWVTSLSLSSTWQSKFPQSRNFSKCFLKRELWVAEKDIKTYCILESDFFKSLAHEPMFIFKAVQLSSGIMCEGVCIYVCVCVCGVCACVCYEIYVWTVSIIYSFVKESINMGLLFFAHLKILSGNSIWDLKWNGRKKRWLKGLSNHQSFYSFWNGPCSGLLI